jgi:hypothetical protein
MSRLNHRHVIGTITYNNRLTFGFVLNYTTKQKNLPIASVTSLQLFLINSTTCAFCNGVTRLNSTTTVTWWLIQQRDNNNNTTYQQTTASARFANDKNRSDNSGVNANQKHNYKQTPNTTNKQKVTMRECFAVDNDADCCLPTCRYTLIRWHIAMIDMTSESIVAHTTTKNNSTLLFRSFILVFFLRR